MSLNIRERRRQVAAHLKHQTRGGMRALGKAIGISKSSLYRHRKGLSRAAKHPESSWWTSEAGSAWLKLLVYGIIYYFGIKHGVGSEGLSEFFKAVRLDGQVGSSPSSLRQLRAKLQAQILAYETRQLEHCQPTSGQGICVGGDETFFGGLPILVMIELSSNYILTEVECDNRTYDTWSAQIGEWWSRGGWKCHFMVSDAARALIKLAVSGLNSVHVPDLFHVLQAVAQPLGRSLGRQISQLQRQQENLQAQGGKKLSDARREILAQTQATLLLQLERLRSAKQTYHQALQQLTLSIHPFHLETQESQLGNDLAHRLQTPLDTLADLATAHGTAAATEAIEDFKTQIPGLTQGIQAWWQWTHQLLALKTDDVETQNWIITTLLPWVYWQQQHTKTRHPELKQHYEQAARKAYQKVLNHPWTVQIPEPQHHTWICWCQEMANHYQRTSSAIEGRNGYLSKLHHAGRGFSPQTLKVATIIHNFDLRRPDGTTAAQRLFDYEFPNLFHSVVDSMGDLPMPRKSSKSHRPKPLPKLSVPA
jgi:Family of unknown function (DUF6399)